jgi:hypothetical protein
VDSVEPARQLRLVILDACRDNPFTANMKRQRQASLRGMSSSGLSRVEPPSNNTLVAYAAKAGSTADDGYGDNSPFTTALLRHLTVPGLDIRLALGRVRDDVMQLTGQRQEPFVYGSLGGATMALVPGVEVAVPKVAATVTNDPNAEARKDYEYFERVGTKDAWDAFLQMHTKGLYAELAKAQRAKLLAAGAASSNAPVVAAVSTPSRNDPAPAPTPSGPAPGEVARMLQTELARVGCYSGAINGEWNATSRRAMESFNRNARKKLDLRASLEALDAVRDQPARVCPLDCDRNFKAEGDKCVRVACDSGFALSDKGTCEPAKGRVKETTRTPPPEQKRQAPPAAQASAGRTGGGGGQVVCDRFGCQTVRRGCSVRSSGGIDNQQVMICN